MVREGRYAAIDIGTVTCRMLVADVSANPSGSIKIQQLAKEYAVTNLGEDVDKTRMLKPEALQRVAVAVDGFREVLNGLDTPDHPIVDMLVMATSASRDAKNADEFVGLLAERGLHLQVISGDTEAMMSFIGASSSHTGENVMVVDVGGGSTEVSVGVAGSKPTASHSFDIGCRRVTERFWDGYPPSAEAIDRAREWIHSELDKRADLWESSEPTTMLAVAGTATSAVSICEKMEVYDAERVDGSVVTLSQLQEIERALAAMTLPELQHVTGLDPRRAPVITAGMVILEEVMEAAFVSSFTASESDILEGMIMYNAMTGYTGNSDE